MYGRRRACRKLFCLVVIDCIQTTLFFDAHAVRSFSFNCCLISLLVPDYISV